MTDADVATTHAEGCWAWGPKHHACAVREIERLRARVAELERTTPSLEWIDLRPAHEPMREMLALSYEQGRRDALRGVQAAALYRHAELWQGRVRLTSADERRDIEACELAWAAAQAAEEAAR